MIQFPLPVIGFVAYSGTGKTTLLEKVIPLLKQQGLRIAAIKHSHHNFEIDKKGKDSDRLRTSGAGQVVLASQYRTAVIIEGDNQTEPQLQELLDRLDVKKLDLVLIEGFRQEILPKLEIHRPALAKPLLYENDPNIVAIVTDEPLTSTSPIPNLSLNRPESVSEFIVSLIENHKN